MLSMLFVKDIFENFETNRSKIDGMVIKWLKVKKQGQVQTHQEWE